MVSIFVTKSVLGMNSAFESLNFTFIEKRDYLHSASLKNTASKSRSNFKKKTDLHMKGNILTL